MITVHISSVVVLDLHLFRLQGSVLLSAFPKLYMWLFYFYLPMFIQIQRYVQKTVGLRFRKCRCMTMKRGRVSNGYDVMSIGKFRVSFFDQIIFSCLPLFCICLPLFFIFKTILHGITWKVCEFNIAESFYFRISLLSFLP